jgi:two-component system cell cycle response regulator CpdR
MEQKRSSRILVAEDEPEMLRSFKLLLEDMGFEVVGAKDGQDCLDAYHGGSQVKSGGFDLVILDYKIPRKNGIEVAKEIAAIAPSQNLLMITAYAGIIDQIQKPEHLKIIAKPYDVDELIGTIRSLTQ